MDERDGGWKRLFRTAFRRSRTPMELVDADRCAVAVNDAFSLLTGFAPDELVGRPFTTPLVPDDAEAAEGWWPALEASGEWLGELRVRRPEGAEHTCTVAAALVHSTAAERDGDGERDTPLVLLVWLGPPDPADLDAVDPPDHEELTARELEVVTLVAHGLSNPEIAERLVVAPSTVKSHVANAMHKTGARTRAHLVAMALTRGLIVEHPAVGTET